VFLHSAPTPVVHMDMKPGNILLNKQLTSKVRGGGAGGRGAEIGWFYVGGGGGAGCCEDGWWPRAC
jgi:hypothetical protein